LHNPRTLTTTSLNPFCKGENQVLANFYNVLVPELFLVAYRYVKSEAEAEDVVADCFEKLLKMPNEIRRQKFIDNKINLKALLFIMVRNQSLDVLKLKKNRLRILEGIKINLPKVATNDSKKTLSKDNFNSLLHCLSKKEKIVLTSVMEGFTKEEIAIQMGLSEKTISNLLTNARKKVKLSWVKFMV
jgi:RNA polymerase sigma factor (sigma-70 family)